jgi:hypothetical protein
MKAIKRANILAFLLGVLLLLISSAAYSSIVPDTGQTKCYDNSAEILCPSQGQPFYGQDGCYSINPPSYTKRDANGNDLPDNATTWAMVRDKLTGCIWETKNSYNTYSDYTNLHDADLYLV